MEVTFCRRKIFGPLAYHDWLQIGDIHYEIGSPEGGKLHKNQFLARPVPGQPSERGRSAGGAEWPKYMGRTSKSHAEIKAFSESWCLKHPNYCLMSADCQVYTRDLASFIGMDCYMLPVRDGATGNFFSGMLRGEADWATSHVYLVNETGTDIKVKVYDQFDNLCWVPKYKSTIPGSHKMLLNGTRGLAVNAMVKPPDFLQVSIDGSHCHKLFSGKTYRFRGGKPEAD